MNPYTIQEAWNPNEVLLTFDIHMPEDEAKRAAVLLRCFNVRFARRYNGFYISVSNAARWKLLFDAGWIATRRASRMVCAAPGLVPQWMDIYDATYYLRHERKQSNAPVESLLG
jgi:hypothetical protein